MSIFIETSQLQDDLALKEKDVMNAIAFSHSLAVQMGNGRKEFWSLPDDRLLAALNADVQTSVQTRMFMDNLAVAINALLDEAVLDRPELAERFSVRAPMGYGRADVVFNPVELEFRIVPVP